MSNLYWNVTARVFKENEYICECKTVEEATELVEILNKQLNKIKELQEQIDELEIQADHDAEVMRGEYD